MPRPLDLTNPRDSLIHDYEGVMRVCYGECHVPRYQDHRILTTYYANPGDADVARRREAERMADRQLHSIAVSQQIRQQRINAGLDPDDESPRPEMAVVAW